MKKKLRALFLLDFFSSLGGTEFYNYNLICGLQKRGVDIVVCIGERPKNSTWLDLLKSHGVPCFYPAQYHHDFFDRQIECAFLEERVIGIINDFKPDVIYVHPAGKLLITYYEYCPKREIPVIATDYTTPSNNTVHWYQPELKDHISKIALFVSRCKAEEEGIRLYHKFDGPIVNIPHLIPSAEHIQEVNSSVISVGTILRLSPEKGLDFLLGAWRRVIESFPKSVLHIYGNGPYESYYMELAKSLGIYSNVVFEGSYAPITGLSEIASRHRIFVQPSLFESIPNAMLELMQHKKAIVATKVGGIPEIICEDNNEGILVEPASTEQLSNAIIRLLSDPLLVNIMSKHAYDKVSKLYCYEKNMDQYVDIFYSVAGTKHKKT